MNDDIKNQPSYLEDTFDFSERKSLLLKPSKSKKETLISNFIWFAIFVVSIAIFYQAYSIGKHFYLLHQSEKSTKIVQDIFDETISKQTLPTPTPIVQSLYVPETAEPEIVSAKEIRPEILAIREALNNDDVIGYIFIEDTTIGYPIVQAKDNKFYLTNDSSKNKNPSGAIFLDCTNSHELTDKNSVIYGHNVRSNSMFHDLRNYVDADYLKSHQKILVVTLYEETVWEVFSAYKTSTSFNYIQTAFDSNSPFFPFLAKIYEKSLVASGVTVDEDDIVLTLSTCTNTSDDMRYAVHAKLIERK